MKHIVLGTAGHVDHGKTSLVKALTSIETDRLKEEKERGITIELGFAPLRLDTGDLVGIVDVPGHERFVKNMVAGAAGIDMVLLVIAADEGVMPQTREHVHICDLLNIKQGFVVVTKSDLVDDEWLSLVVEDIREFLSESFLDGAPIVPVSSLSGAGIPDCIATLNRLVHEGGLPSRGDFFRLPVDRIFTMKGFGTVVTGTLIAGSVNVGDTVAILPAGITTKVRGLQIHNEAQSSAERGFRTAVNFQGLGRTALRRGDTVAHPDIFTPSSRMDILIRHLPGVRKKLKHRAPVRFHIGTAAIMGRIYLPDRDELAAGEQALGQILLEEPTTAMAGDHFVIRSYSPATTIGGGHVLDPTAVKIKRFSSPALEELRRLNEGSGADRTEIILSRAGIEGITPRKLSTRTGLPLPEQQSVLEDLLSRSKAILVDREERRAIAGEVYEGLLNDIISFVGHYHQRVPLKKGPAREELRISLGSRIPQKLFNRALLELEKAHRLSVEKDIVALAGHDVRLDDNLDMVKDLIMARYREAGLAPPATKELIDQLGRRAEECRKVVTVLIDQGALVKIHDDMLLDRAALDRLRNDYRERLVKHESVSPTDFKDMTGLSRKYIIPLMEYFDKTNLTIRVGNHRILRESGKQ